MSRHRSRRAWMKGVLAGLGGLAAAERRAPAANADYALISPKDAIKITKLEVIPVHSQRTIFLKMHTDAGIVGLGEGTVEGRIPTVMAAIAELEEYLIGKDPRQPALHWQAIYRHTFYRGGVILTSALSAVDIAMWDIKGKALGVPIFELLGGPTRDRIPVYGTANSPEQAVERIKNEGYRSFKIYAAGPRGRTPRYSEDPGYVEGAVENFRRWREAVGPNVDLGCELHGDYQPQAAMLIVKALEQFQPWFYEEVVQFENLPAMAKIAGATPIPIATGERMVNKWQFRELLALGAASLLQPDITHCAGITEMKAIASMAEAYYAAMLPHCKEGIIGAVASMHVSASIPNLLSHELPGMFTTDTRVERSYLGKSYIKKPLTLGRDGCILIAGNLNAPGLGVELDDNLVENERGVEEWEFPPMWDSQDGSVNDH